MFWSTGAHLAMYNRTREQIKLYLLASGGTWITFTALLGAKAKTSGLSLQLEFVTICFTQGMGFVSFVFLVQGSRHIQLRCGSSEVVCAGGEVTAARDRVVQGSRGDGACSGNWRRAQLGTSGNCQCGSWCIGKLQHPPFPARCLSGNDQRGAAAPSLAYTAAHWCLVSWKQHDGLKAELELDVRVTGSLVGLCLGYYEYPNSRGRVWGILNQVSLCQGKL